MGDSGGRLCQHSNVANATCAACEAPIGKGDKFVLSGSEVFHRRCSSQIERSRLTRAYQEASTQTHRAHRLEDRVRRLTSDLDEHRALVASYLEQIQRLKDRVEQERKRGENEHHRAEAANHELGAAYLTRTRLRQEVDQLQAEVTRLQAERVRVATEAIVVVPAAKQDPRDDAEIRFSLLDLDMK